MILKRFTGIGVRGDMDFNISFNDRLNFLIGINGSGKTTVLRLIEGLLAPSLKNLIQIEFSDISIEYYDERKNSNYTIRCTKKGEKIVISQKDKYNILFSGEIEIPSQLHDFQIDQENDIYKDCLLKFEQLGVVIKIKEMHSPLFLGLNRRPFLKDYIINKYEFFSRRNFRIFSNEIENNDYVDKALFDIQNIIFDLTRKHAKLQSLHSDRFRKKVIKDIFQPNEISIEHINYEKELIELSNKKQNLIQAIRKLDIDSIYSDIDYFFEYLSNILKVLTSTNIDKKSNKYVRASIEWILNCSQLERMDKIISYGNQYTNNILQMKDPIIRFTQSVNLFFKEANKEIIVDETGKITINVKRNNKTTKNSIFELSSGEKQLIIILAHLAFKKVTGNSNVFIIDEPELSLHISWQEIFVDALIKASPDTQFILATHSPSILSKLERRNLCIDLSKVI